MEWGYNNLRLRLYPFDALNYGFFNQLGRLAFTVEHNPATKMVCFWEFSTSEAKIVQVKGKSMEDLLEDWKGIAKDKLPFFTVNLKEETSKWYGLVFSLDFCK